MLKNITISSKGYTMAEAVAVLVLLGIMAAVVTPKFFDLQTEAEKRVLHAATARLNAQATMAWTQCRIKGVDASGAGNKCTTEYDGYTGDLGDDFIISGEASTPGTPGNGTIKLTKGKNIYSIIWTDIANDGSPGNFALQETP